MPDIEMAAIPAGAVTLHDARRSARRTVELEPFEIGVFAVTEEALAELLGVPAAHARRPAVDVSWQRAIRLCNALSEWEGLDPAYSVDGEAVRWFVDSDGYRLPTEAEWEFACRAGSAKPQYGPLADVAWTEADGVGHPSDVGGKMPNLFGLFDTLGNAWEWCWDLLDPARYGDYRVFRGGGFDDPAWSVRASTRRGGGPRMHHDDVGMRLARGAFDGDGAAQGWSAAADEENALVDGPVPFGWTPLR
ncbi:formylglycine-generating enzyme family protein [Microbacterium halophytorum]|uniref:formylglycine-generating enzyme family protein n=1 Tax=Microbacterium halophytorum TaxID=2067568 RepID=UPI000CFBE67E|nr:SUMF1/EgtB/PvdO family nonheme iron enzyme [Microbacterium halophytorum]